MLVVHKHKKNINLSRDMNYRSLLFLMLLFWAWQIKKWPNPKIKGLVWKKILILYCLHKTGNLLCEKHGQKANSKFFECPRVLGSPHPWMKISQGLIFFFINLPLLLLETGERKKIHPGKKILGSRGFCPFFAYFGPKMDQKRAGTQLFGIKGLCINVPDGLAKDKIFFLQKCGVESNFPVLGGLTPK